MRKPARHYHKPKHPAHEARIEVMALPSNVPPATARFIATLKDYFTRRRPLTVVSVVYTHYMCMVGYAEGSIRVNLFGPIVQPVKTDLLTLFADSVTSSDSISIFFMPGGQGNAVS